MHGEPFRVVHPLASSASPFTPLARRARCCCAAAAAATIAGRAGPGGPHSPPRWRARGPFREPVRRRRRWRACSAVMLRPLPRRRHPARAALFLTLSRLISLSLPTHFGSFPSRRISVAVGLPHEERRHLPPSGTSPSLSTCLSLSLLPSLSTSLSLPISHSFFPRGS